MKLPFKTPNPMRHAQLKVRKIRPANNPELSSTSVEWVSFVLMGWRRVWRNAVNGCNWKKLKHDPLNNDQTEAIPLPTL